jgi:hypothetical protein
MHLTSAERTAWRCMSSGFSFIFISVRMPHRCEGFRRSSSCGIGSNQRPHRRREQRRRDGKQNSGLAATDWTKPAIRGASRQFCTWLKASSIRKARYPHRSSDIRTEAPISRTSPCHIRDNVPWTRRPHHTATDIRPKDHTCQFPPSN